MKRIGVCALVVLFAVSLLFPAVAAGISAHPHGGPPGLDGEAPRGLQEQNNGDDNGKGNSNGDEGPDVEGRTPPGLEDKGGLPPGLHDRDVDELPFGIRYNPNFQEAIKRMLESERIEDEFTNIEIFGKKEVAVPSEGENTYEYKAYKVDEEGSQLNQIEPEWDLVQDKEYIYGETVDDVYELTVEDGAVVGTEFTITATYKTEIDGEEKEFTAEIDVEIYEPEISEVEIVDGEKYIALEETDEDEIQNIEYEAKVTDQHGNVMQEETVDWDVTDEDIVYDFTVDEDTNELSVEIYQKEGSFTITAESGNDADAEMKVTVYVQKIEEVEIKGDKYIALEDNGEETLNLDYEAFVLDNEGRVMEEKIVEWTVESGYFDIEKEHKTIEDNVLTIELPAEEGNFTVTAEYDNEDINIEVELEAELYYPAPEKIEISGEDTVEIPGEGDEDTVEEYNAVLKDQNGQEMEEEAVTMSLDEGVSGVDFDEKEGELTVTDEANVGAIVSLKAEYDEDEDITGSLYIELE